MIRVDGNIWIELRLDKSTGFYFKDEASEFNGPFDTFKECFEAFEYYCRCLENVGAV